MRFWRRTVPAAGLLVILGACRVWAASSATINIDVTISASLSVSIDAGSSSTQTVTWSAALPNQALASASTATVLNDSGARTEKWSLSTDAGSIDTGGASPGTWSLAASTTAVGPDQFAVQAVFGSSNTAAGGCPAAASTDWNASYAPLLTTSPVTYTSTIFADPSLNAGGGTPSPDVAAGQIYAGSKRALCWRVIAPSSTSTTDTQNIQIIITAAP